MSQREDIICTIQTILVLSFGAGFVALAAGVAGLVCIAKYLGRHVDPLCYAAFALSAAVFALCGHLIWIGADETGRAIARLVLRRPLYDRLMVCQPDPAKGAQISAHSGEFVHRTFHVHKSQA